jgi:hypothetical protein
MLAVLRQAGWHQKTPNPEENTFEYTKKKAIVSSSHLG